MAVSLPLEAVNQPCTKQRGAGEPTLFIRSLHSTPHGTESKHETSRTGSRARAHFSLLDILALRAGSGSRYTLTRVSSLG